MCFINKSPILDKVKNKYQLNFQGRVTVPSIKNFQLIDLKEDNIDKDKYENIYIQFGKIGDDLFNLDVSYPFSIYQAFGIAISLIDSKIALN